MADPIDLTSNKSRRLVDIVGESHYQDALQAIAGDRLRTREGVGFLALLVPEPDNPKDPGAIAIRHSDTGKTLGYLSRENAVAYGDAAKMLHAMGRAGA